MEAILQKILVEAVLVLAQLALMRFLEWWRTSRIAAVAPVAA